MALPWNTAEDQLEKRFWKLVTQGIDIPDVDTSLKTTAIEWSDDLRRGIWPRSAIIWIIAFWTVLLIIRPWETKPWLEALHLERTYAIFAIVALCLSGRFRIVSSTQTTSIVLWFLALAVSSMLAFERSLSFDHLYVYMTVFIFFFGLISAIQTPYQLLFIVTCYIVTLGVFFCKSQVAFHFSGGHQFSMGVFRLMGDNHTYQHPNSLAGLAVVSLPLWLFLWQAKQDFTCLWPRSWRKAFTWGLGMYFPLAVSSIILTNSRIGLLGFIAFLLLVAMSGRNVPRFLASIAAAALLLGVTWLLMPESNRHRLETLWSPREGDLNDESAVLSAEGRKLGFLNGMEMFRRFPATGVGLNNFAYYRKNYLDGDIHVAHNTYGAVLGETGAIGGAALLFVLLSIFRNASQTKRLAKFVPDPIVQLLAGLAIACRRSILLLLLVAAAGDYQGFAPLYWIAGYCLLAARFAQAEARRFEDGSVVDIPIRRDFVNSDSFDYAATNAGADGMAL